MPLHRVYHPTAAFTDEEKRALSEAITAVYSGPDSRAQLPEFYVVVLFIPVDATSLFVGGRSTDRFVRIHIQHMARHFDGKAQSDSFLSRYEKVLEPYIKEKGFDWEVTIEEVNRELWRENGIPPPEPGSKAEDEWRRLNKPVPFSVEDNISPK